MNQAEKAKELVNKFLNAHFISGGIGMNIKQAKQCALIVVEECMLLSYDVEVGNNSKKYWQQVKTEIEIYDGCN